MQARTGKAIFAVVVVAVVVVAVVMLLAHGSLSSAQVGNRIQYKCFSGRSLDGAAALEAKFNELGAQGWEFVGTAWVGSDQPVNCFKR